MFDIITYHILQCSYRLSLKTTCPGFKTYYVSRIAYILMYLFFLGKESVIGPISETYQILHILHGEF